jgi:hypothetical protein
MSLPDFDSESRTETGDDVASSVKHERRPVLSWPAYLPRCGMSGVPQAQIRHFGFGYSRERSRLSFLNAYSSVHHPRRRQVWGKSSTPHCVPQYTGSYGENLTPNECSETRHRADRGICCIMLQNSVVHMLLPSTLSFTLSVPLSNSS